MSTSSTDRPAVLGGTPTDRSGAAANLLVLVLVPLLGAVALVVAERLVARVVDHFATGNR